MQQAASFIFLFVTFVDSLFQAESAKHIMCTYESWWQFIKQQKQCAPLVIACT